MHPHTAALHRIRRILDALAEPPPSPTLAAREEAILAYWPRSPEMAADVVAALWPTGRALPGDDASIALRAALAPDGSPPSVTSVGAQLRQLARRSPRLRSQAHPRLGVKLWWITESTEAGPV